MNRDSEDLLKIGVVIPCYKVGGAIFSVLHSIGPEVSNIYVVDDACPHKIGLQVKKNCLDDRVTVLINEFNLGVGGAVIVGYDAAINDGCDVIVKIDGDGQMDPALIKIFVEPIIQGFADYTKGNRFFNIEDLSRMPLTRLFGNAVLSLMAKLSTGYWDSFDPTNGFTAISSSVLKKVQLRKISKTYFFETDMLFRLNLIRATILDIPMSAKYDDEISNLKIYKIFFEFLYKHLRNFIIRIFYTYYLRGMSIASLELPIGIFLFFSGIFYGAYIWQEGISSGSPNSPGAVTLAAMQVLVGLQLLLAFLSYDISLQPKSPISVFGKKN